MSIKRLFLLAILTFSMTTVFSQNRIDTVDMKLFWLESVEPLIQKDTTQLKSIIEFPLGGEWGFIMGLEKDEKDWSQADFFKNYDKLFSPEIISLLKKLNYHDAEIYKPNDNLTEILVGIGWEEDGFEKGIVFRYKRINGVWKLYVIQAVG